MQINVETDFRGKHYEAHIETDQASIADSARRTKLNVEGYSVEDDQREIMVLRRITFPDLMGGTVKAEIKVDGQPLDWPISFDVYLTLPEVIGRAWENAVYTDNPAWTGLTKEKKAEA